LPHHYTNPGLEVPIRPFSTSGWLSEQQRLELLVSRLDLRVSSGREQIEQKPASDGECEPSPSASGFTRRHVPRDSRGIAMTAATDTATRTTPTKAAATYTVQPLLLGEVEVDHTFIAWASEPGRRLWIPTIAYLILGADRPILVDASFRDAGEFTAASGVRARRPPEQELEARLGASSSSRGISATSSTRTCTTITPGWTRNYRKRRSSSSEQSSNTPPRRSSRCRSSTALTSRP
jgi:hypothetical protein